MRNFSCWRRAARQLQWTLASMFVVVSGRAHAEPPRVDDSVLLTAPLNATGIKAKRSQIISFIWGAGGFPTTKKPSLRQSVPSPIAGLGNLQSVEALRISMDAGEYTLAYHFIPSQYRKNRLVIVHAGHGCWIDDGPGTNNGDGGIQRTTKSLLAQGYGVLVLSMPRSSPANRNLSDPGTCKVGNHDDMFNLPITGNALKFFVEPVIVSLNYLSQWNYSDFNMLGLSGGGWTTVLAAAIDTRIKHSLPVAGSVPMYLRVNYNHDLEQYLAQFYGSSQPPVTGVAGYLDLYLLGSRGLGRSQTQILNRRDNCCFGERQHQAAVLGVGYEAALRTYEARLNTFAPLVAGSFKVVIDEVAAHHTISDYAINTVILPTLAGASALATTMRGAWGSSLCMDVWNYILTPQPSNYVYLWDCHGGDNQLFDFAADATIRGRGGMCLDVPDFGRPARSGDTLQMFTCHSGLNQQFDLLEDGSLRSRFAPGLCVDFSHISQPRNGVVLELNPCNPGANQLWSANRAPLTMSSAWAPALCVDIPDNGRPQQSGDTVQVFACHGRANQRFRAFSDGSFRTEQTALCLGVPQLGRPPQAHDPLQILTCDGSVNQRFDRVGDQLQSRAPGQLCVDLPDNGRAPQNQDRLQLFPCHSRVNQRFYLRP